MAVPTRPSALAALREALAGAGPAFTVGLEEELMLLDRRTLDLLPAAWAVLDRCRADGRFKRELPAAQLEIVLEPCERVDDLAAALLGARRALAAHAAAAEAPGALAGAGAHPFAAGEGEVSPGSSYDGLLAEYGPIARRQQVFGLHVHVAVPGPERALAVYNALRGELPLLAALAANAPFYEGAHRGLASVRPHLSALLPRQGVPPAFPTLEAYAEALEWGADAGRLAHPLQWWWELRLHPRLGTVEVRVCDAQATVAETAALAAVARALVARLADRFDAGEPLPVPEGWRIAENRWLASRDGPDALLADLRTGRRIPARERLAELAAELAPVAGRLGDGPVLARAPATLAPGGAARQRAAARGDARAAAAFLAARFLATDGLPAEAGG